MEIVLEPQRRRSHIIISQKNDNRHGIRVKNRNLSPIAKQRLIESASEILQSVNSSSSGNVDRFDMAFNAFILRNPQI